MLDACFDEPSLPRIVALFDPEQRREFHLSEDVVPFSEYENAPAQSNLGDPRAETPLASAKLQRRRATARPIGAVESNVATRYWRVSFPIT